MRNLGLTKRKDEIESVLTKAESLKKGAGSYNLACLYSLLNDKVKTFECLEKSLQYKERLSRDYYEQDEDFNNIKEESQFKSLLDKYFE